MFINRPFEELGERLSKQVSSIEKPVLELKTLLSHLKYAYLGENSTLLMIIIIALTLDEEEKLLRILKKYNRE